MNNRVQQRFDGSIRDAVASVTAYEAVKTIAARADYARGERDARTGGARDLAGGRAYRRGYRAGRRPRPKGHEGGAS